jgi:saccharopine dehydrogenase-like NADP-dependent oxidoreductase
MQTPTILLLGAGKSATVLIDYLQQLSRKNGCAVIFADANIGLLQEKVIANSQISIKAVNIIEETERKDLIEKATIVISLLPPHLHYLVALQCIAAKKHLLTASYVDDAMKNLKKDIEANNILFLCEMGLDPGIDHMSAMQLIDNIKNKGGQITSFKSHCGGLISPESDTNLWHYKISWNPKNIVLAGKDGAIYKEDNTTKTVHYPNQFLNCQTVHFKKFGDYAFYANRNSLPYTEIYGLQDASTFLRTTLRHAEFCKGWHNLVTYYNLTNTDKLYKNRGICIADFIQLHQQEMGISTTETSNEKLKAMLDEIGVYDANTIIEKDNFTAADVLQQMLETKWQLQPTDKDLVLMKHEIEYSLHNQKHYVQSSLAVQGKNALQSAMAKTVGLPLGIAATLLLENKLSIKGLHIPTISTIYTPVLAALQHYGIVFEEEEMAV